MRAADVLYHLSALLHAHGVMTKVTATIWIAAALLCGACTQVLGIEDLPSGYCGDGIVQPELGEVCEGAGCENDCRPPVPADARTVPDATMSPWDAAPDAAPADAGPADAAPADAAGQPADATPADATPPDAYPSWDGGSSASRR